MSTADNGVVLTTEFPQKDKKNNIDILLPHLVLTSACLIFLALNFWCYRRNNYERYQRKVEKFAHAMLSCAPRRVTSMMRYSDSEMFHVFPECAEYNLMSMEEGQKQNFGTLVGNCGDFCHEPLTPTDAGKRVTPVNTDICKREPLPMIMKPRINLFPNQAIIDDKRNTVGNL